MKRCFESIIVRQILNPRAVFFCLLLGAAFLMTSMRSIIQSASGYFTDLDVMYWFTNGRTIEFNPVLYVGCSVVPLSWFCEERANGCYRYAACRSGSRVYAQSRVLIFYVTSLLCSIITMSIYAAGLCAVAGFLHIPVDGNYGIVNMLTSSAVLDLFLRIILLALSASFWGMLGLITAILEEDLFLACACPAAVYMCMNYLSQKWFPYPYNIGFANMENLYFASGLLAKMIQFSLWFLACSALLGIVAEALLRRKMDHV